MQGSSGVGLGEGMVGLKHIFVGKSEVNKKKNVTQERNSLNTLQSCIILLFYTGNK